MYNQSPSKASLNKFRFSLVHQLASKTYLYDYHTQEYRPLESYHLLYNSQNHREYLKQKFHAKRISFGIIDLNLIFLRQSSLFLFL